MEFTQERSILDCSEHQLNLCNLDHFYFIFFTLKRISATLAKCFVLSSSFMYCLEKGKVLIGLKHSNLLAMIRSKKTDGISNEWFLENLNMYTAGCKCTAIMSLLVERNSPFDTSRTDLII